MANHNRTKNPRVEMIPAYLWICPECGEEVFERGLVPEMSQEDLEVLRTEHGIEPWETGEFVMMPREVKCPECGETFGTNGFRDDAPEDESERFR